MFLIISQENTCVGMPFSIKLYAGDLKFYLEETSEQAFSCVYFETASGMNCLIFCCCWLILLFFDDIAVVDAAISNS